MQIEKFKKRTETKIAESTMKTRLSGLKHLETFMGGGDPTPSDVEEWVDYMIDQHREGEMSSGT